MAKLLPIQVACATPARQVVLELNLAADTNVRAAVIASGIAEFFPEIDVHHCDLGVWYKPVLDDRLIQAGDRIELYRPLIADPKAARRKRAEKAAENKKNLRR